MEVKVLSPEYLIFIGYKLRTTAFVLRTQDFQHGDMAELVYAYVSEAYGVILEGSSPSIPTILIYLHTTSTRAILFLDNRLLHQKEGASSPSLFSSLTTFCITFFIIKYDRTQPAERKYSLPFTHPSHHWPHTSYCTHSSSPGYTTCHPPHNSSSHNYRTRRTC